jgi:hypothetical protein
MKSILISALALSAMTTSALAQPGAPTDTGSAIVTLTDTQLDTIAAGAITPVTRNPAGHETQGQGQAQTTTNENPAGHAPEGQNP